MDTPHLDLLYHFCRLQLPVVALPRSVFDRHLQRTFELFHVKEPASTLDGYIAHLYAVDWTLHVGCLEGQNAAWGRLFAARTGRSDCLLVDSLRARAARLYPRDEERQISAVDEFWSHLLISETPGSVPILARFDGQRPLVPWLIRVFQNWHISLLRGGDRTGALPEDDFSPPARTVDDPRWHDAFREAARQSLDALPDGDLLILGLRLRYRMSQREVASLLGVHEGTVSRQTDKLREKCLEQIEGQLQQNGWTGDSLRELVLTEMAPVLLDEPRLGASSLAGFLSARGKQLPAGVIEGASG